VASNRVVAFVPIKLNSQRLSGKNLKILGPMPLLQYVLNALIQAKHINDVYVFCSDDSIIEFLPNQVKFLKREKILDSDETLGVDIYESFISHVDSDYYLLAHATSPFIKPETITNAIDKVLNTDYDSAFTAQTVKNFVWFESEPLNYSLDFIPRTQDIEPVYVECSAFFVFSKKQWVEKKRRIGESPYMVLLEGCEAIDIDDQEDFLLAEFYLERGLHV
jgi:CMP-N-acetylneuraminic acid synthetase